MIKMEHYEMSKLLNDSTVLKFVIKKWAEVNDLSSDLYSSNRNIRYKPSLLDQICVIIARHILL